MPTTALGRSTAAAVVLTSMAVGPLVGALAECARSAGVVDVAVEVTGGRDAERRVEAGDPCDLVVLAAAVVSRLVQGGHLVGSSRRPVADSEMAVAVPAGARRPAIGTEEALRAAVRQAGTVAYSTGPSGDAFVSLLRRWEVLDELAGRLVQAPPGMPVARLLAEGRADLGVQQRSEVLDVPGADVVGPLPPACQVVTTFVGARTTVGAADLERVAAGRRFLDVLTDAAAAPLLADHGLSVPSAARAVHEAEEAR